MAEASSEIKEKAQITEYVNSYWNWKQYFKNHWQLYAFLILPVAYILLFSYIPMVGILLAFKDFQLTKGILGSSWIGFGNFETFFSSPMFWTVIKNTLVISLYSLAAGFPIPIILALALNEIKDGFFKKTVQMVTYAPYFISMVIMVGIIFQFFSPRYGVIGLIVKFLGGEPVDVMASPELFSSIYVWSGVWQTAGYNAIIYIAALSGIDQTLYDAARIDGATRLKKILHVDIPGIAPTIIIILIVSMGYIMNIGFEKIYLMQNPLNSEASEVITTYIFKVGLINADYAYSTAVGVFNSVINLILLIIVNQIARKTSETSLW